MIMAVTMISCSDDQPISWHQNIQGQYQLIDQYSNDIRVEPDTCRDREGLIIDSRQLTWNDGYVTMQGHCAPYVRAIEPIIAVDHNNIWVDKIEYEYSISEDGKYLSITKENVVFNFKRK